MTTTGIEPVLTVRPAMQTDAGAVARIYNYYIASTVVTFEESAVSSEEIARRMKEIADVFLPWLVVESDGEVIGYAYASPWKGRCAYRFTVEVTVYLAPERVGRGTGSALFARLLSLLRERGLHTALGGIALPNEASIALHEKFGFEKVAHFHGVGFKFERRIDVGYWQLQL